jgi:DNA polymerase III subunit beta
MKLICERGYLNAALSLVIGRAKANNPIPILSHVLLTARDGKLKLCATDLEAMSESHLSAEVHAPGVAVLDAHRLAKLAAAFPKGAQIMLEGDEREITIKCGRSTYKIPSLPAADWPTMESHSEPSLFSLDASVVKLLFEVPAPAVESKGRVYLMGGFLHQPAKGKISVVATNGHILIQFITDADFVFPARTIVPKASMAEIAKIATGMVKFECSENLIVVETDTCRFTSKLIDGTFPDYQRVIPTHVDTSILVDREDFITAIRRLISIDDDKDTLKLDWKEGGGITLTLHGAGSGEEQIEAEVDMPSFGGMGVAPSLLLPALESFGGETVRIFVTDAGSAIRLSDNEASDVIAVVMPKRI